MFNKPLVPQIPAHLLQNRTHILQTPLVVGVYVVDVVFADHVHFEQLSVIRDGCHVVESLLLSFRPWLHNHQILYSDTEGAFFVVAGLICHNHSVRIDIITQLTRSTQPRRVLMYTGEVTDTMASGMGVILIGPPEPSPCQSIEVSSTITPSSWPNSSRHIQIT